MTDQLPARRPKLAVARSPGSRQAALAHFSAIIVNLSSSGFVTGLRLTVGQGPSTPLQTSFMPTPYLVPDERIEESVLRELTIPLLDFEQAFEPYIREMDVTDFDKRDKRILLALSVLEQKADYSIYCHRMLNFHLRALEAESIRLRRKASELAESESRTKWRWELLRWAGMILGAGVLTKILKSAGL